MKLKVRGKVLLVLVLACLSIFEPKQASADHSWILAIQKKLQSGQIDQEFISKFRTQAKEYTDSKGRVTPELQEVLYEIEDRFGSNFTENARAEFLALVADMGGKMHSAPHLPKNQTPYWLLQNKEFAQFRSTPEIPKKADIVVIGAGLTGSSAAYHLREFAQTGKTVIVLDAGGPASQASGRNGGNFQLLSESYSESYDGLIQERTKWLKEIYPTLTKSELDEFSAYEVKALLQFNYHNFLRFTEIVKKEKIECDFTPQGWLRIANSKAEEVGILQDLGLIHELGIQTEVWSPEEIKRRLGISAEHSGRFIIANGNYHPYKFVIGLLNRALSHGVKFYAGVKVAKISENESQKVILETSDGIIETDKVIVATNAFTPKLFPELKVIQTVPSQVMNLEHMRNNLQGLTVTERNGDIYYNFPASGTYKDKEGVTRGMIHFGLDFDHSVPDPWTLTRSEELFQEMKQITDEKFPDTQKQPASRVWVGPMAFTPDHVPVIGFMYYKSTPTVPHKNIVVAAAFQGYGGSYCVQAGNVAAEMALTGEVHADVPEALFSPKRFYRDMHLE